MDLRGFPKRRFAKSWQTAHSNRCRCAKAASALPSSIWSTGAAIRRARECCGWARSSRKRRKLHAVGRQQSHDASERPKTSLDPSTSGTAHIGSCLAVMGPSYTRAVKMTGMFLLSGVGLVASVACNAQGLPASASAVRHELQQRQLQDTLNLQLRQDMARRNDLAPRDAVRLDQLQLQQRMQQQQLNQEQLRNEL